MRNSKGALYAIFLISVLSACTPVDNKPIQSGEDRPTLVSAPGELVSLQKISLTPPNIRRMWEFKIEYLARENTMVKAGDVVIKFDAQRLSIDLVSRKSDLDAVIKEAQQRKLENEARLEQHILNLAEAKKNMDIAKRKVEITDVSRSAIERDKQKAELDISRELYQQAQQRVKQHKVAMEVNEQVQLAKISKARFRVNEIKENIKMLTLVAPKSGMVALIPDREEKKPAVGDNVYMGTRVLAIPSLEKIAVKVEFDESYTSEVSVGGAVRVTLDAFPERPFTGRINELGQSYRNKSQHNLKVVFDAWVSLDELDLSVMRPGMKATVELLESEI